MLQFTSNVERFERHIMRENSGCWRWTGFIRASGYGHFTLRHGKNRYTRGTAHRAAWTLYRGTIPAGMFVCHHCDNPSCVNPDHLFVGTARDNTNDMMRKGRRVGPSTANRARGDNHPSRLKPECLVRGTAHHQAKITENEVLKIRASTMKGVELARIFGLAPVTISRIRRHIIWRHVP